MLFVKKLHHWESSDVIFAWLSFPLWHIDRNLKRVSPFPGKQSRDQLLGLGGPGICDSYPRVFGRGKAGRSWGHKHILIFLVLCFTLFTSVLFKVTMSVKITDTSASKRTTCFGVTFILFFCTTFFLFLCSAVVPEKSRMPYTLIPLAFLFLFGNH